MEQYADFRKPSDFARQYLFYTDGMGVVNNSGFHIDRQSFRNNVFMYVAEGSLYVEQNGYHHLNAGDMVVMRLSEAHKYYAASDVKTTVIWMHFADSNHPDLLGYIEGKSGLPYVGRVPEVKDAIEACHDASRRNAKDREMIYSFEIYQALLCLVQRIRQTEYQRDNGSEENFIRKVREYIEAHIHDKPDLERMALACGFSKYHFIRLCKQYLGDTPVRYFYRCKIEHSKGHLIYTGESITSIALNMGFDSQSHYSRTFSKIVGKSPRAYIKENWR